MIKDAIKSYFQPLTYLKSPRWWQRYGISVYFGVAIAIADTGDLTLWKALGALIMIFIHAVLVVINEEAVKEECNG